MSIYGILVGVFLVAGILKNTKFNGAVAKGKQGENIVIDFLQSKRDGLLINNLTLKINDSYSQIDHVYITDKAIFVIETKNHSGLVLGKEEDRQWTVIYGPKKFPMYNPLKQNETHIKMLQKALDDTEVRIIPITIFSHNKCKIANEIKGVYTMDSFRSNYSKLTGGKAKSIDKRGYYRRLKKLNLSKNIYHRVKQVSFAKNSKKKYSNKK